MTPRVVVDAREHSLIELFKTHAEGYEVAPLPVGDIMVEYNNSNRGWICERKTGADAAASIKDGRWKDQKQRILDSGKRPVFVFEGDFREAGSMYKSVFSAWVGLSSRGQGCALVFRTWDVGETFDLLCALVGRLEHPPPCAPLSTSSSTLDAPKLASKRDKNADCVFIRQLMCVPSVSEHVARALVDHFGNIVALQEALKKSPKTFPIIDLGNKQTVGKAQIEHLAKHLLGHASPDEPEQK